MLMMALGAVFAISTNGLETLDLPRRDECSTSLQGCDNAGVSIDLFCCQQSRINTEKLKCEINRTAVLAAIVLRDMLVGWLPAEPVFLVSYI